MTDKQKDELIAIWRNALQRIANDNSGHWGWIAHHALEQERKMK